MAFKCPACEGGSLKIELSMELPPGDVDETSVQMVKCENCGFRGIAVYEESRRGSMSSDSFWHMGFEVSDEDLQFVQNGFRLCPARSNQNCQCETHLAWAKRPWPGRDMTVKRRFRMDLAD